MNSIRQAIQEHWHASDVGDVTTEHAIYADDAVLDYPQSGERFHGRTTIAAQRGGHGRAPLHCPAHPGRGVAVGERMHHQL
ncbi:nuclear transport factor 2 family protein [Microbacterium rhizosphaerae]